MWVFKTCSFIGSSTHGIHAGCCKINQKAPGGPMRIVRIYDQLQCKHHWTGSEPSAALFCRAMIWKGTKRTASNGVANFD